MRKCFNTRKRDQCLTQEIHILLKEQEKNKAVKPCPYERETDDKGEKNC